MATSSLRSRGPKSGRNGHMPHAFSGPTVQHGQKLKSGYSTPTFWLCSHLA